MFNKIKNYINDKDFKLTFYKDKLNIINYISIISLEDYRISIIIPSGRLIIKGNDLFLNKLYDNELLILGNITSIEVENDE